MAASIPINLLLRRRETGSVWLANGRPFLPLEPERFCRHASLAPTPRPIYIFATEGLRIALMQPRSPAAPPVFSPLAPRLFIYILLLLFSTRCHLWLCACAPFVCKSSLRSTVFIIPTLLS